MKARLIMPRQQQHKNQNNNQPINRKLDYIINRLNEVERLLRRKP